MEFQYYVVEFLTPVNPTVPRFVCIPKSWIRSPILDKKAAVSFPDEPYVTTVQRIVLAECYAQEWMIHMAEIKFGCDNLNEAQKKALEQCVGIQNVAFEENEHVTPIPKQGGKKTSSVDGKTPQRGRKRSVEKPDHNTKSKHFKSGDPKQNNPKYKYDSTPLKLNRDQVAQKEKIEREKQILKKLSQVFNTMRESFDEMTDSLDQMRDTIGVIKKSLYKTVDMTSSLFTDKSNKQYEITETYAPEKDSRRSRRFSTEGLKSFVFPDNTDKSLKWTLRHQVLTEGLIELLPKSGVYVRLSELERLDSEADGPSQAALMVMKEIFSDKALSVCSLNGRGNRDALDTYSRKVMIMYLNEYFVKRNWKTDEPSIWRFLRSKLPEFRTNEAL